MASIPSGAASVILRFLSAVSLTRPHITPLAGYLAPVVYVLYLLSWLQVDQESFGPVVEVREIVEVHETVEEVSMTKAQQKKKKRRLNGISKEVLIKREGEDSLHPIHDLPRPSPIDLAFGSNTTSRTLNVASLLINTLLTLAVLDQTWTNRLALAQNDLVFARTIGISPYSSDISFRYPSQSPVRVAYRPLLAPELQSIASPTAWESSPSVDVSSDQDWMGLIHLDGLIPGLEYEYRVESKDSTLLQHKNFTTFPDPALARFGSHFRFVHAGAPTVYPRPYELVKSLPPVLPLSTPYTSLSLSHIANNIRKHRLRQPAWTTLADWLEDMRERKAWAPVKFGIIGDANLSKRERRQFMACEDVQRVYDTIPVMPTGLHGVLTDHLEPAALSSPSSSFIHGDTSFFRLRLPFTEAAEPDAEDWRVDLDQLALWLKTDSTFKFVVSPDTLSPFFGGTAARGVWREAVLDILATTTNVIVLAELPYGFASSVLRKTIVEFAAPSLDQTAKLIIPDETKAHEATVTTWKRIEGKVVEEVTFERTDRLLVYRPATIGAKWTSVEVETAGTPRVIVMFFDEGQPFWRLEVVGLARKGSKAVGTLAENFQSVLRRLGLMSIKWF